jgi:hypothetical protein
MGMVLSPAKARKLAQRRRHQEESWKARNGPVTAKRLTAAELTEHIDRISSQLVNRQHPPG